MNAGKRTCLASFQLFNDKGHVVGAGDIQLPDFLDWMPIEVKGFWFTTRGHGHSDAKYLLLKSQGEQLLISDVSLRLLTHTELMESHHGSEERTQRYIDEGGWNRIPRNQ